MTRAELLQKIRSSYETFHLLLYHLEESERARPGVIGTWSVKDIVAHIAVHEQRMLKWMTEKFNGRDSSAYQPYDMPETDLSELNEQIYQQNRSRDWSDVITDWAKNHAQTLSFFDTVNESDLMSVNRFQLLGGEALWAAVAANTYEHYEDHGSAIREWMDKVSRA